MSDSSESGESDDKEDTDAEEKLNNNDWLAYLYFVIIFYDI